MKYKSQMMECLTNIILSKNKSDIKLHSPSAPYIKLKKSKTNL